MAATTKTIRVLFFRPDADVGPDAEPHANVWVDLTESSDAPPTITLHHDYGADLAPTAGWTVRHGERTFEVRSRAGLVLTVAEKRAAVEQRGEDKPERHVREEV